MRNDLCAVGFRDRGDLLRVRDTSGTAHVHANVARRAACEEHPELLDRVDPFSCCDRYRDAPRDLCHLVETSGRIGSSRKNG